jgi:hypothetical protein
LGDVEADKVIEIGPNLSHLLGEIARGIGFAATLIGLVVVGVWGLTR